MDGSGYCLLLGFVVEDRSLSAAAVDTAMLQVMDGRDCTPHWKSNCLDSLLELDGRLVPDGKGDSPLRGILLVLKLIRELLD
jgi:hypothetical protein